MILLCTLRLLFPVMVLVMGLKQRPLCRKGRVALVAEFALLATVAEAAGVATCLFFLVPYAWLFSLDYCFHDRMGWALDGLSIRFALRERSQTKFLLLNCFGRRSVVTLAGVSSAAVFTILWSRPPAILGMASGISLALVIVVLTVTIVTGKHLPPVPNLLSALFAGLCGKPRNNGLSRAERLPLPSKSSSDDSLPNILIVVCESLCLRLLNSPEGCEATPRYQAFLAKEAARTVAFPLALSNSSVSEVSYPSIFTGLSPDESSWRFHRNPLVWALAKTRGYRTSLYSSQALKWCNLSRFLLDDSLDRAVYREVLNAPVFSELSMDDRIMNRIAMDELVQEARPFCAVINYNMLHYPYTLGERKMAMTGTEARQLYLAALRRFDDCLGDLLDALAVSGQLENTAIFFTADHGETPEWCDLGNTTWMPLRVNDLSADLLRVPFWVRLPEGAVSAESWRQLCVNADAIISNIDFYPTVMHLLGFDAEERNQLSSGQSLFEPLRSDRNVIAFNTGELREWKYEPFALTRAGRMLLFHDYTQSLELISLEDPLGQDLWRTLASSEQAVWLGAIAKIPALHEVFLRRGRSSSVLPQAAVTAEYNARAALGMDAELHQLNNWALFSAEDWENLSLRTAQFIGVEDGDRVFEAGCGAGAFLHSLKKLRVVQVAGVDLAGDLIAIARNRLQGEFWTGDIQDLSFASSESYDKVVSQGVFLYLPDMPTVRRAALEMVRIAKPGGTIYIGVLNDPARIESYRSPHVPSGNAFIARSFWAEFAARHSLELTMVDQDAIFSKPEGYDAHSRLRYSVLMRKTCGGSV